MSDQDRMALNGTKEEPYWVPPFTVRGMLKQTRIRQAVNDLLNRTIQWRWARPSDWPTNLRGHDFRLAQRDKFGFVSEVDGVRIFLVPRGYDWPEWALASHDEQSGNWTRLGSLEPAPNGWFLPALEDRNVAD
jgi:hypothetical protein